MLDYPLRRHDMRGSSPWSVHSSSACFSVPALTTVELSMHARNNQYSSTNSCMVQRGGQVKEDPAMSRVKRIINLGFLGLIVVIGIGGCDEPVERHTPGSPESTIVGFAKAAGAGDAEKAREYMLPGGVDYEDVYEMLIAEPSSGGSGYRKLLEAIDESVPARIVSTEETDNGLEVHWEVTFEEEIEGQMTYVFKSTLKKVGGIWKIDNF